MTRPYIMVAPNGARRRKSDHPGIPITLEETLAAAKACARAGADALHLHVRDENGKHTLDPGRYGEALAAFRDQMPGFPVQITTEAAGCFSVGDQLECLTRVKPDWASVSVREIARDVDLAPRVYGTARENGTRVQHIVYDVDDLRLLNRWRACGIIDDDPLGVLLVLGRYRDAQPSRLSGLNALLAECPEGTEWMLCAFGATEHACLHAAAQRGGHLRVGFENSLVQADGTPWPNNASSVRALAEWVTGATQRIAS